MADCFAHIEKIEKSIRNFDGNGKEQGPGQQMGCVGNLLSGSLASPVTLHNKLESGRNLLRSGKA